MRISASRQGAILNATQTSSDICYWGSFSAPSWWRPVMWMWLLFQMLLPHCLLIYSVIWFWLHFWPITISRRTHKFESAKLPPFTFRWIKCTWNAYFYRPNWELSESCEEEAGSEPRKCIVKYSRSFHWGVRQIMNC